MAISSSDKSAAGKPRSRPSTEIPKPPALKAVPRQYKRFGIPADELLSRLRSLGKIDAVFMTSIMTYWYPGVTETIALLRKTHPGVPIILGGIYATLCHTHAEETSGADSVLAGNFSEAHISACSEISILPGTAGTDSLPPDLPLSKIIINSLNHFPLLLSLGCRYRCDCCASATLQPVARPRSFEAVCADVINAFESYRTRTNLSGENPFPSFAFYDDSLLETGRENFERLVMFLEKNNLAGSFNFPNGLHVRHIDSNTAQLIARLHPRMVRLGYDALYSSPSSAHRTPEIKRVTGEELALAVKTLIRAGLPPESISSYLIYNRPGEEPALFIEALETVFRARSLINLALYTLVPGTADFEKTASEEEKKEPLLHNRYYRLAVRDNKSWQRYVVANLLVKEYNALTLAFYENSTRESGRLEKLRKEYLSLS